jgi:large repetitive protein
MRSGSTLGVFGAAVLLAAGLPALAQSAPPLRSAASFVVLGNSSVKNSGASRVTGNVGASPGNVVTGFSPGMFHAGDVRRDDALARQARIDGDAAADALAAEPCTVRDPVLDPVVDPVLGGQPLLQNIYCFTATDVRLSGTLILDARGDRDAVWIFRIDGTLTVANDAAVLVIGNGYDGNVFWSAGQATLGEHARFIGNLFARSDIALQEGASLSGRAFARSGSVTLQANAVSLCCAPLQLAPGTLPDGALATPYRQVLSASGGTAPYTFTIGSGTLPLGLALASDGTLAGTPASLGTFEFTVTATDARGCSSTAAYSIGIGCGDRTTLPPAAAGVAYTTPVPFDGTAPFNCSISAGTLSSPPWGVSGSASGCVLSAMPPDAAGTYDFVVESTDALGVRRSRCLTINVGECPIVFLPPDPPAGTACEPYAYIFRAEGGTQPYRFIAPAAALPPGWSLLPGGDLFGTTTNIGTYIIPVTVTDALGQSCSRTFTISVNCPASEGAAVTLPRGIVGVPYNQTIPSPACGAPATFSFVSGDEPPGLAPVTGTGVVSGTPAKKGTYRFVVASRSTGMCTTTHQVTIDIDCPDLQFSPLPPMVQNVPYDQTIIVTGGIGPYRLTAPALPAGLMLDGYRLHGTPTTVGSYTFAVTAEDETSGCTGMNVYDPICPTLVVTPPVLPGGTVGDDYPYTTFMVTRGTPPYHFAVSTGLLPPGLDLSCDGTLSGTPTLAGTYAFGIRVTDFYGCSETLLFCAIDIGAGTCPAGTTITLSPPDLPPAMPNMFYSQAITAVGGTALYTYTVTSGTLPAGLTLDPLTGILSGVPAVTGTFPITVTSIDANGCRGSACYILRIGVAIPTISPWMLFAVSILLAGAGWVAIGRR